jgi:D-alanyl-D-alanine carboxypeptidase/D-alanyl-D-alanine-endopeptidase (penicillin-binding protein 4)
MSGPRAHVLVSMLLAVSAAQTAQGGPSQGFRGAPRTRFERPDATTDREAVPRADVQVSEIDWAARIERRLERLSRRARPRSTAAIDEALATEVRRIATAFGADADIGIAVRSLESGTDVLALNENLALNPASNHKLLSAAAALELLGDDYRFETRVLHDHDALVVVGEGDPTLQIGDLAALVQTVGAHIDLGSIRRVIVDDSAFSGERFGPGYDPDGPGYSYMAPSGALSLQFNTVEIEVRPTQAGMPVEVVVEPACPHIVVESDATTGRGAPLSVETHERGEHTVVTVSGSLRRKDGPQRIRRRVTDPGLFTGAVLAELVARQSGIEAPAVERGRASRALAAIAVHRSGPLHEALRSALKFSNNVTTEQVLRTLAWRMTGQPGDWQAGHRALERFWSAIGGDPDALVFENASGYSRHGRLTARALVDVLALATEPGSRARRMLDELPIAGIDGTLRDRLTRARGRVLAKTGTLHAAAALSGVVVDDDGRPTLSFSILVNGAVEPWRSRTIQEQVVAALVEHASRGAV